MGSQFFKFESFTECVFSQKERRLTFKWEMAFEFVFIAPLRFLMTDHIGSYCSLVVRRGSVTAAYYIYNIVSVSLHEPVNRNLSSCFSPPFSCPVFSSHYPNNFLAFSISLHPSLFQFPIFLSLTLSPVLIVYTLTFKKLDSSVQVTPCNFTSLPFS